MCPLSLFQRPLLFSPLLIITYLKKSAISLYQLSSMAPQNESLSYLLTWLSTYLCQRCVYLMSGFELRIKFSFSKSPLLIFNSLSPSEYIHTGSNPTAWINTIWHYVKNGFAILYYCKYVCYNFIFMHYWLYSDKLVIIQVYL